MGGVQALAGVGGGDVDGGFAAVLFDFDDFGDAALGGDQVKAVGADEAVGGVGADAVFAGGDTGLAGAGIFVEVLSGKTVWLASAGVGDGEAVNAG